MPAAFVEFAVLWIASSAPSWLARNWWLLPLVALAFVLISEGLVA